MDGRFCGKSLLQCLFVIIYNKSSFFDIICIKSIASRQSILLGYCYFLQSDNSQDIFVEDGPQGENVALFTKLEDDGEIIDVYLVPLTAITPAGGSQVIVGTTKENVENIYVWEMNETVKPSIIVTETNSECCTII